MSQPDSLAWRLTEPLTRRSRRHRYELFMRTMKPTTSDTLLDVGVTDSEWRSGNFLEALYPWPEQITAVSTGPLTAFAKAHPRVRCVVADGRRLPFADAAFDIGFSNAVIEHDGGREDQRLFMSELVRTCRRVFVATPNAGFPVDPHTLLPFVHWLPRRQRDAWLRRTGRGRWASEQVLNPLRAADLLGVLPDGVPVRVERQRMLGMTSVLIAIIGPR
jgi:hypothetical protein